MADKVYDITGVRKKYASFASKISVLWPLLGRRSLRDSEVIKDMTRLLYWWRYRLSELKLSNWDKFDENIKLQYMRNCPPAGVYTDGDTIYRCCKLANLCPWCYMRQVEDVFNRIAEHIPRKRKEYVRFVEISASMIMKKKDAGSYLDGHFLGWQSIPHTILKRLNALGAFRMVFIDPKVSYARGTSWRFVYRILAMVPKDWEIPSWLDNGKRKIRITDVKNKKGLISIVGRTCRYPVGLFKSDPLMAIISLNARHKKRCNEMTGCFRSKKVQHDDDSKEASYTTITGSG